MVIEKNRGLEGLVARGRGTGFVAIGALLACSWIVGCGGESDDGGSGDDGGTAGKGGSSGSAGTAGSASGAGGTGNAGSGGTAGTSGGAGGASGTTGGSSAGEGASSGTTGDAGDGNVGGEAAGGSAGDANGGATGDAGESNDGGTAGSGEGGSGGAAPEDMTVRGRIIDFYRHPIPGVTIGINGTDVVTNAQGEFAFEDVPEVYDASFVVDVPNPRKIYGWVFQGLTRRDPTLQVFQGISERSRYTDLRAQDGAPTATQNLTLAMGSEYGTAQQNIPANGRDFASYGWFGPSAIAATAHGLMWSYDEDSDLPTDYVSYTTFPFALDEDAAARPLINVSVAPTEITQANIGGTVTDLVETGRVNYGFVRFTSGATIDLFADDAGPGTFSYLVPALPNGSITFAAADDDSSSREFALVHQDGVAPGTTNLALTIPATPSLTAPANGADDVDDTTGFRYQNRQEGVGAVVVHIQDFDLGQGIYVVTANTEFTIPAVLEGGFALRNGGEHYWQVEAHGQYASVDEMTSSTGYADSFAIDTFFTSGFTSLKGPRTSSGTLAISSRRFFTYTPQ